MGLRDDMRERERKSLPRYAMANVMDHLIERRDQLLAEDEARHRKKVKAINEDLAEAAKYVVQADEAYEIVSRAVKMLKQMEDGEWPTSELPGVRRALDAARKKLL